MTVSEDGTIEEEIYSYALTGYVDDKIDALGDIVTENTLEQKLADLVDSAPETLNTLNELANALGDDPNFATTIANQIGVLENKVGEKSVSD